MSTRMCSKCARSPEHVVIDVEDVYCEECFRQVDRTRRDALKALETLLRMPRICLADHLVDHHGKRGKHVWLIALNGGLFDNRLETDGICTVDALIVAIAKFEARQVELAREDQEAQATREWANGKGGSDEIEDTMRNAG